MVGPVGMNGAYCRIIRTRSNVCGTVTVNVTAIRPISLKCMLFLWLKNARFMV